MLAVDKILQEEFQNWQRSIKGRKRDLGDKEQFLREKFQIMSKDQKIGSIIKSFFVRDVDEFIKAEGVRENLVACAKEEEREKVLRRRKRSTYTCTEEIRTCPRGSYHQNQDCDCGVYGKVWKMLSDNDNYFEDRSWSITCKNIPQYQAEETGYDQSNYHQNWEFSPHQHNAFVSGLTSWFGGRSLNDRQYQVRWSRNSSFVVGECRGWEQIWGVTSLDNIQIGPYGEDEVIGGLKSEWRGEWWDRIFFVKVCKLSSDCK